MTAISESLSVSTSTVIRQLHKFKFKTDLNHLPEHMSWDEYSFKKGKMSFIAGLRYKKDPSYPRWTDSSNYS